MITAIVTSDNHLGAFYARLRPDRLEQRRRALQHAFERVVDAAIERRVDLFLHAGDLFDRPDPRNAERLFVARQVHRLNEAGIPIVAIAGNHDSPRSFGYDGGVLPQEELAALGAISLLRNTDAFESHTLEIKDQRVCVRGMSSDFNWPAGACPLGECVLPQARGGDIDLVLLHYGVQGWMQPQAQEQEPCLSLDNLNQLPADAICVGHLHARQQKRLDSGALLLNPGATEHIHFGEERQECGFWLLRLEPGHAEAEYVELTSQPMRTLKLDVTDTPHPPPSPLPLPSLGEGGGDRSNNVSSPISPLPELGEGPGVRAIPADLTQNLLTDIEEVSQPDQLLRVRITGRLKRERFHELDLTALLTRGNELNFSCQLDTDELTIYDETADLPLGYGVSFDVGEELQNTTDALADAYRDDPHEQQICRLAGHELALAYDRLTKGAR